MSSGEHRIQTWAEKKGMRFDRTPDPVWYVQWEPFDTMVAPMRYQNAAVGTYPHGHIAIAEPWTAEGTETPLDRTIVGFATHDGLRFHASARIGAWFNTRVAYVGSAKPNEVSVGDPEWDDVATTFAMSPQHACAALHPALRKMLRAWRFQGHIELRMGGLAIHVAGLRPVVDDYAKLAEFIPAVVANAAAYPT